MDNINSSRVYINPNFNRRTSGSTNPIPSNTHSNANFPNAQNKKIYINPKFIPQPIPQPVQSAYQYSWKTNEETKNVTYCLPSNSLVHVNLLQNQQAVANKSVHVNLLQNQQTVANKSVHVNLLQNQQTVANKSRFTLVRCNENKPIEINPEKKQSLTVNVSKYKSVRVVDVKSRLDSEKQLPKQLNNIVSTQSSAHVHDQKQSKSNLNTYKGFQTQYTYLKDRGTEMNTAKTKTQYSYIKSKDTPKRINTTKNTAANMSIRSTKIKIRRIKVKCYTPCRLFRKYGRCTKNEKGHCKYLHDRKHVSICKKFLKGFCHDNACLLSHELSDKKMPTCYFYLQGMCTKENCPYLHVKVNEKAMVCPDFKKGYCEKGNTCLYRHVETKKKRKKKNKMKNANWTNCTQTKYSHNFMTRIIPKQDAIVPPESTEQTAVTDCRYYKEVIENDETNESCQVIKPTRCKLGALPSFIKF